MPLLILFLACSPKGEDDSASPARTEGEDTTVTVFDGEYLYYGGDEDNRRTVDVEVDFPDERTTYGALTGRFALRCPDGGCDWLDRYGTFGIVLDAGTEDEQ